MVRCAAGSSSGRCARRFRFSPSISWSQGLPLGVRFVDVAREAGLQAKTIFGGEQKNKFLMETTGCGCAFFDFDNDGWLDIFLVNGTRFETDWPAGQAPVSRLYKNNRDGTFTDVTLKAGRGAHRAGARAAASATTTTTAMTTCSSLIGAIASCGTITATASLRMSPGRPESPPIPATANAAGIPAARSWITTATATWICSSPITSISIPKTAPLPGIRPLPVQRHHGGVRSAGTDRAARTSCSTTTATARFADVSEKAGILKTHGTYGLGVAVADFDNDGWPDIYVANDSTSSALYQNNHDGTFSGNRH